MKKRTVDDIPRTETKRGKWTITTLVPGRLVFCDLCGEDYTDRPDVGGYLFLSKAVCPACGPKFEVGINKHGEARYITSRCPANISFANFVRSIR